jgi:hypothetical protein
MTLEMPDVEEKPKKRAVNKEAQAAAHKRWRESPKGAAYRQKLKERKAMSK